MFGLPWQLNFDVCFFSINCLDSINFFATKHLILGLLTWQTLNFDFVYATSVFALMILLSSEQQRSPAGYLHDHRWQ